MKTNMNAYLNKNSASDYTEIHLMMTQKGSKHVVINIKVNNICYYFYLNCCVHRYKYTVFSDTQQDATHTDSSHTIFLIYLSS
jgi:hypothetical protein